MLTDTEVTDTLDEKLGAGAFQAVADTSTCEEGSPANPCYWMIYRVRSGKRKIYVATLYNANAAKPHLPHLSGVVHAKIEAYDPMICNVSQRKLNQLKSVLEGIGVSVYTPDEIEKRHAAQMAEMVDH